LPAPLQIGRRAGRGHIQEARVDPRSLYPSRVGGYVAHAPGRGAQPPHNEAAAGWVTLFLEAVTDACGRLFLEVVTNRGVRAAARRGISYTRARKSAAHIFGPGEIHRPSRQGHYVLGDMWEPATASSCGFGCPRVLWCVRWRRVGYCGGVYLQVLVCVAPALCSGALLYRVEQSSRRFHRHRNYNLTSCTTTLQLLFSELLCRTRPPCTSRSTSLPRRRLIFQGF